MKKLLFLLLILVAVSLPTLAKAEGTILDQIRTLPLKEGVMIDFQHSRVLNTVGFGLVGYNGIGLDLAYIGTDGVGAVLNYNLQNLPVKNVPILSYTKYLNIGYGIGYRTMALADVDGNPKSDNQLVHGPVVFIKLNF